MRVYLRDGSAQTIIRAATLRQKLQIKLSISPSHSILTPGQPVPALTLWRQAPGRVASEVSIFKSLVWLDPDKIPRNWDLNPGSSALEADALTTRPTRLLGERGAVSFGDSVPKCPLSVSHPACRRAIPRNISSSVQCQLLCLYIVYGIVCVCACVR